ncbi:hypothetical protein H257_14726 [Aphanomyces astaci]|uniref:Retroviral polymerase SH3-like domain-containing protein n=1 Tax=Aphanomyces astaci TaxID=112090 RepID=W4FSJ8_APHAT|nr:hypothetical protein H257_14726 [Aphanomyces astaci]ETV69588.1 hypothetical protein H257_14726 [Aphanomyces astaci]|eukprot:XP_009840915.1 hypothetical protein H257_14726 [Aphanomyces astaci]
MKCSIKHDATTIATSTLDTNNKMYILDQAATHERLDLVAHEPNKTRTPKNKVADLAPTGGTLTHRRRQPLRRHGTRNSHQLARTTNEVRLLREEQDHANKDTHPLVPSRGVLGVRLQMHYENDVSRWVQGMKVVRFVNSTDAATQQDNFAKGMACSKAQTGRKVKVFRSNSGSEYSSNAFNEALGEWGVVHETSTALPTTWQMNQNKKKKLDPKATKCVMMGYAEHQKAYKLYDLEQKKMVTSVQVQFRENEFLGERTPIDEYLVTVDDDDDDDEEGSLKGRRPLAQPLHPRRRHTRAPSTNAAAAPPVKRSHFMVPPPPLPRRISDDLYRTRKVNAYLRVITRPNKQLMTMDDFNAPASTNRMTLRDRNTIRTPSRFIDEPRQPNNSDAIARNWETDQDLNAYIDQIYGDINNPANPPEYQSERAILAPKNVGVDEYNAKVLRKINCSAMFTCLSVDSVE